MQPLLFITVVSLVLGLLLGSWQDWFKSEGSRKMEREESGWFLNKLGAIFNWFWTLLAIYIAFSILKALWKLA